MSFVIFQMHTMVNLALPSSFTFVHITTEGGSLIKCLRSVKFQEHPPAPPPPPPPNASLEKIPRDPEPLSLGNL